jgi:hypothetical protein
MGGVIVINCFKRRVRHINPQNHARTTAVRRIVDIAMLVDCPRAELMSRNFDRPGFLGAGRDGVGQRLLDHFREKRQYVNLHTTNLSHLGRASNKARPFGRVLLVISYA